MRVLAIDVGSSSVKAGVFAAGQSPRIVREPVDFHYDGRRAETPADTLLAAVERAAKNAAGSGKIDLVALDTFSPGVVITDSKGKLRAGCITHQDRRSVDEARQLEAHFGKRPLLAATGNRPFPGGIGSTTLLWVRRHAPALLHNVRVGQPSSYILYHWTGGWTIDPSQAAFLGLLNIRTGDWFTPMFDYLKLPRAALPEIAPADSIIGRLSPSAARRLGIASGTPVIGGCVDTSAAFFNMPLKPGTLLHNAGSTDVQALLLPKPHPAEDILTRPLGTGGALPALWLAASTIAAAGAACMWAHQTLFSEMSDQEFFSELDHAIKLAAVRSGTESPLHFNPTLAGDRTAMIQTKASIEGLTLSTTRLDILIALAGGLITESVRRHARLKKLHRITSLYTTGGNAALGRAMRRAWSTRLNAKPIDEANLTGLHQLGKYVTKTAS